jgi:hypothetical protein
MDCMHASDKGRPQGHAGRLVGSIVLGALSLLCFYGAVVTLVGAIGSGESLVTALFIAVMGVLLGLVFAGWALHVTPGPVGLPKLGRSPHPHKHERPKAKR